MAISSIGVGSGLPLEDLLKNLRNSENQSLALIQSRATTVQNRLSGYGTIKSSIEALKTASEALGKAETFGALKTSVNNEAFTATATAKAIAGQYSVEVLNLASPQTLMGASQADRSTVLATDAVDTVKIKVELVDGTFKEITLNKADTSLEGIAKAINGESGAGVNATLIQGTKAGDASPSHHLLLTAKKTGDQAAVKTITVEGSAALQSAIGFTTAAPGTFTETAAQNASLSINGIKVESQSNTVENGIDGVTLNLVKKTTEAAVMTLTKDNTVASKAIDTFVSAYNNLQNIIKTLTSYNADNQTSAALTGDNLARNVQSQVRDALNVAGSSGAIRSLSQMGITTDPKDGTLKVDSTKLAAALKDNMVDVEKLLSGENGISKKLAAVADTFVKSGGLISSATDGMTTTLKSLEKQYQATSDRIDAKMENYRKQFTALDSMVAKMNSTSSYLTQQLSMLGNMNDQK